MTIVSASVKPLGASARTGTPIIIHLNPIYTLLFTPYFSLPISISAQKIYFHNMVKRKSMGETETKAGVGIGEAK